MIDKMIEEILDYSHCAYKSNSHCIGTKEDCKKCPDYKVDYQDIVGITEKYKADKCKWTLIDEEENVYDTDCRNPHILMNGTPKDNGYSYCPYCGKKIKVVE